MESLDQLDGIGIKEILDHDPRPTFVLDLDPDDLNTNHRHDRLDLFFCNEALRSYHVLLDLITGDYDEASDPDTERERSTAFRRWVTSITSFDDSKDVYPFTHLYHNMLWTGSTIRKRWRLISGNQCHEVSTLSQHQGLTLAGGQSFKSTAWKESDATSPHSKSQHNYQSVNTMSHSAQSRLPNESFKELNNESPVPSRQDEVHPKRVAFSSRSSTNTRETSDTTFSLNLTAPDNATPDWTVRKPKGILSDHLVFARSIDWASTPLVSNVFFHRKPSE